MDDSRSALERFTGFADLYDAARPRPPVALVEALQTMVGPIRRVVDLGCGTGRSALLWLGTADEIVAVEPCDDMRRQAEKVIGANQEPGASAPVRLIGALAHGTGLPEHWADVVTCSQSFHWMEPTATLAEAARILRPGGVFAAYDCDWPPTVQWQAEEAFQDFMDGATGLLRRHEVVEPRYWDKEGHLGRLRDSGHFCYCREVALHHRESGDATRLVDLALSQGGVASLRKAGMGDEELGLERFRSRVEAALGAGARPWFWTYRVRLGIRL